MRGRRPSTGGPHGPPGRRHRSREPEPCATAAGRSRPGGKRVAGRRPAARPGRGRHRPRRATSCRPRRLDWGPVDLAGLSVGAGLPLLVGNDATLAGVAEARTGAAAGARDRAAPDGRGRGRRRAARRRPAAPAPRGAAGEYGHLPFGDRSLRCPAGPTGAGTSRSTAAPWPATWRPGAGRPPRVRPAGAHARRRTRRAARAVAAARPTGGGVPAWCTCTIRTW